MAVAAIAYGKLLTCYGNIDIWHHIFSYGMSSKYTIEAPGSIQLIAMSRRARLGAAIAAYLVMKKKETVEEEEEEQQEKLKRRRIWVREWIERRSDVGFIETLYGEIRSEDPEMYRNFVRMSAADFDLLLEKITPLIQKQDTVMRKSIPARDRLCLTLRYLSTGDSYRSLMYLFRIPSNTISVIVPEVCNSIYNVLKDEYMKVGI